MKKSALMLAGLLLISTLISACSSGDNSADNGDQNSETNADNSEVTTVAAEEGDNLMDELGTYDFDGYEFTFISRSFTAPTFNASLNVTEETGEVLNDELYRRNRRIEDRFNVTFNEIVTTSGNTTEARTAVIAGDAAYDVITTRCVYAFEYAQEGLLYSVNDMPEIDLSREYWNQSLLKELSIGNKNYFASGAFNLTSYDFSHCLLINKEMANNYNMDDIYSTVTDHQWTFDKMNAMMTEVTQDIDGDGVMKITDQYGILSAGKQIPPNFWISAGTRSVYKNSDDIPEFRMGSDEKFHQVLDKTFQIIRDNGAWYVTTDQTNIPPDAITMFQNNQSLFIDMTCYFIQSFRAMDADFGIIPYPLWNEQQDTYYSRIEGCELFCVPVTNANLEMTGVLLEAMASESARNVMPAYYEVALKGKYARDEQSEKMLDIIFADLIFDFGDTIWCPDVRDGIFFNMIANDDRDLSSKVDALGTKVNTLIDKTITAFNELK